MCRNATLSFIGGAVGLIVSIHLWRLKGNSLAQIYAYGLFGASSMQWAEFLIHFLNNLKLLNLASWSNETCDKLNKIITTLIPLAINMQPLGNAYGAYKVGRVNWSFVKIYIGILCLKIVFTKIQPHAWTQCTRKTKKGYLQWMKPEQDTANPLNPYGLLSWVWWFFISYPLFVALDYKRSFAISAMGAIWLTYSSLTTDSVMSNWCFYIPLYSIFALYDIHIMKGSLEA